MDNSFDTGILLATINSHFNGHRYVRGDQVNLYHVLPESRQQLIHELSVSFDSDRHTVVDRIERLLRSQNENE